MNPYFEIHQAFRRAGARVLMSSGQACVLFGIAAFSRDGDWVVCEDDRSCEAVRAVLAERCATYRLGAPLEPRWLSGGWTSAFEFRCDDGYRARCDFVSRPPRVPDIQRLWQLHHECEGLEMVDLESLILLKQTRRQRDYSIIGALAEAGGLHEGNAEIALRFLQDYDLLREAAERWPEAAASCDRQAVRALSTGASRRDVVVALAVEQDEHIQADTARVQSYRERSRTRARNFAALRSRWEQEKVGLTEQHAQLVALAGDHLRGGPDA